MWCSFYMFAFDMKNSFLRGGWCQCTHRSTWQVGLERNILVELLTMRYQVHYNNGSCTIIHVPKISLVHCITTIFGYYLNYLHRKKYHIHFLSGSIQIQYPYYMWYLHLYFSHIAAYVRNSFQKYKEKSRNEMSEQKFIPYVVGRL